MSQMFSNKWDADRIFIQKLHNMADGGAIKTKNNNKKIIVGPKASVIETAYENHLRWK